MKCAQNIPGKCTIQLNVLTTMYVWTIPTACSSRILERGGGGREPAVPRPMRPLLLKEEEFGVLGGLSQVTPKEQCLSARKNP